MAMNTDTMLAIVHDKERRALKALIKVYGDDVNLVLNGLHAMSARLAMASGVSSTDFVKGIQHHWNFLADAINDSESAHVRN